MPGQYFRSTDAELSDWAFHFATEVPAIVTAAALPITVDDAFIAARTAFSLSLAAHDTAHANAMTATSAKNLARTNCVNLLRSLVTLLRAQPLFTDAHALQLGLPVYDQIATANVINEAMSLETPALNVNADGRSRASLRSLPWRSSLFSRK